MTRLPTLAAACLCALASLGGDDEARFRPKAYAPSQTLRDRSYSEKAYTPSAEPAPIGKRIETPAAPSRWRLFGRQKALDNAAKFADKPVEHETAYRQDKQVTVRTFKADPGDEPDHKPYQESGKKLADGTYTPAAKPNEKNPLLTPRQGIKAPEPAPK